MSHTHYTHTPTYRIALASLIDVLDADIQSMDFRLAHTQMNKFTIFSPFILVNSVFLKEANRTILSNLFYIYTYPPIMDKAPFPILKF